MNLKFLLMRRLGKAIISALAKRHRKSLCSVLIARCAFRRISKWANIETQVVRSVFLGCRNLGLGVFLCLALCNVQAALEVTGRIKFRHFQDATPKIYSFAVLIDGCRWRIQDTNEIVEAYDSQEICWDGRQLYHLVSQQTQLERANKSAGAEKRQLTNVAVGFISENQILHDLASHEIGPLWLAFASSCYLSNRISGEMIEPVVCYGLGAGGYYNYWKHPFKQVAHWQMSDTPPFLPKEAVFMDDGILRHPAKDNPLGKRLPPHENGFTNVIYSVIEWTNCGNYVLPSRSLLQIFSPNDVQVLTKLAEYDISLSSVTLTQPAGAFVPNFFGRTIVSEGRFPELGFWMYDVTNNMWPEKELVAKSRGYQDQQGMVQLQKSMLPDKTSRRKNLTILAVFCALGILPIAYILARVRKKTTGV